MKSPSPVHGKRPITKTTPKLESSGIALQLTALMDQDVALRFPGQFGQVEYKVPPSSHPPALPLVFPSHYQTGRPHPSPAQAITRAIDVDRQHPPRALQERGGRLRHPRLFGAGSP